MATHPHHNMSNLKQVILLGKIFFFYTNIVKESILLSNMPGKIMLPVNRVLGCSKTQEGLRLPSGYMTAGKCRAMTVRGMQEQIQEPSPVAVTQLASPFLPDAKGDRQDIRRSSELLTAESLNFQTTTKRGRAHCWLLSCVL